MNTEDIEHFFKKQWSGKESPVVKIGFKTRAAINGIFVEADDFEYLKGKNFWRVVNFKEIKNWQETHSIDVAKIFNGSEFQRLSLWKPE